MRKADGHVGKNNAAARLCAGRHLMRGLYILGGLVFMGCGQNDINVDIVLNSTSGTNPMVNLISLYESGNSRGVFFQFDPLNTNPNGINALQGTSTVTFPALNQGLGLNPAQDTFSVDTSMLTQGVLYRMSVVGLSSTGLVTHSGIGDCPVFVGAKQKIKICFGSGTAPQLGCPGLTFFQCCEGVNHLPCI